MLSKIFLFFILYIFVKNILKLLVLSKRSPIDNNSNKTRNKKFDKNDVIEADFKVLD